jgi:pyridoxamine 5'-phosphate oxidase
MKEDYPDKDNVPLPPYWGGYAIKPHRIEFWQGRASRLHDRFEYKKIDGEWKITRLSP